MTERDLTPIEQRAGIYFKRDDLYAPFGQSDVNGGKLRQCVMLIQKAVEANPNIKGIITYCSIHSPQGPITAAVAEQMKLPCIVAYGGTTEVNTYKEDMPRLVMAHGGQIEIVASSGRHNVLKAKAEAIARQKGYFIVQYGINLDNYGDVLIGAVADQVKNLPDGLSNLYVTCGSGITASGIIVGIERYQKRVGRVHLVATAFDREEKVKNTLRRFGVSRQFVYHDLFHKPGFVYEKKQFMRVGGGKIAPTV